MLVDPKHEQRVLPVIAQMMARNAPQPTVIELVRARMIARMAECGLTYE